jgi:predicted acyl esterase
VGGQNLGRDVGPRDQREIGEREDYLRFATPVLEEDLVIAGHIDMELFAATSARDATAPVQVTRGATARPKGAGFSTESSPPYAG